MSTTRGLQARYCLRRHRHLLGEFRPRLELLEPGADARVYSRDRIAAEREPVGVDEPRNIEDAERVAQEVRGSGETPVEGVEFGAEFLRRGARGGIGEA